jgi:hypothetical protein
MLGNIPIVSQEKWDKEEKIMKHIVVAFFSLIIAACAVPQSHTPKQSPCPVVGIEALKRVFGEPYSPSERGLANLRIDSPGYSTWRFDVTWDENDAQGKTIPQKCFLDVSLDGSNNLVTGPAQTAQGSCAYLYDLWILEGTSQEQCRNVIQRKMTLLGVNQRL